jgi:hypothetical protein
LENGIIEFVTIFNNDIPSFSTTKNLKCIYIKDNEQKINIPKIYFSVWSKSKLENIVIINGDIPFVKDITRPCKCGDRFIFGKWNFCYECDRKRKLMLVD